ncbi:MAG: efflux RND transporter periplasmic adaptor subunit [Calditrichota bacterium]
MKRIKRFLILPAALLMFQCGVDKPEANIEKSGTPVQTVDVSPQTFSNFLRVTGTVKARNHVQIMVEEAGILRRVLVDKGQRARAGQTLAVLENKPLTASWKQAEAALKQAELDFKSKKVLYEKKAISENDYLMSEYAFEAAKASYELADARYRKLFVSAPIGGLINERYYDMGAYGSVMTPIFELIDNAKLKIRAGVAERFIADISEGTPVEITFDAWPGMVVESKVSFVSRSINPQSRTFNIEIELPNEGNKLAPEMVANLKILRQKIENQIVVPLEALMESEKGWYVFLADGEAAKRRMVEKLSVYEDKVQVEGLKKGDRLVVVGQQELAEGDTLQILN